MISSRSFLILLCSLLLVQPTICFCGPTVTSHSRTSSSLEARKGCRLQDEVVTTRTHKQTTTTRVSNSVQRKSTTKMTALLPRNSKRRKVAEWLRQKTKKSKRFLAILGTSVALWRGAYLEPANAVKNTVKGPSPRFVSRAIPRADTQSTPSSSSSKSVDTTTKVIVTGSGSVLGVIGAWQGVKLIRRKAKEENENENEASVEEEATIESPPQQSNSFEYVHKVKVVLEEKEMNDEVEMKIRPNPTTESLPSSGSSSASSTSPTDTPIPEKEISKVEEKIVEAEAVAESTNGAAKEALKDEKEGQGVAVPTSEEAEVSAAKEALKDEKEGQDVAVPTSEEAEVSAFLGNEMPLNIIESLEEPLLDNELFEELYAKNAVGDAVPSTEEEVVAKAENVLSENDNGDVADEGSETTNAKVEDVLSENDADNENAADEGSETTNEESVVEIKLETEEEEEESEDYNENTPSESCTPVVDEETQRLNELRAEWEFLLQEAVSTYYPLSEEKFLEARRQPKLPGEEAILVEKYSAIKNLEDRAFQILLDLGMIEESKPIDMERFNEILSW